MPKIIIAGSRKFDDYDFVKSKCDHLLRAISDYPLSDIEIVSGGALGADRCGERYAKEKGYRLKIFKPDWAKHGVAAGPIRNKEMAEYATHCICFWNGNSKGTQDMIHQIEIRRKPIKVILV